MLKRLAAYAALSAIGAVSASAAPIASRPQIENQVILVSGGCGPAFHRDPFGVCVPNRRVIFGAPAFVAPVRLPPPCPRGYHRDPDPARRICYPNL